MSRQVGAKGQVARLLALVPYVHAHDGVRVDEAAAALGVTPRQLIGDLKVLFMCGRPGGYPDDLIDVDLDALQDPDGDGVIRVSNADYLARPLRLSPTEATALIVALRAVRHGSGDAGGDVVDRTLAKLEAAAAAVPEGPQLDLADLSAADGPTDEQTRALLADAIERGRQVRLSYYVPTRDEESERVVDPHRLFERDGSSYLHGWCHRAGAVRVFRLDRIHEAAVLGTPVSSSPPPDEEGGWFSSDAGATPVVLRLAPQARWVPEYFGVADQRELDDGGLEVTMLVADPRWIQRLLLRLAPWAEVVSPPDIAGEFTELVRSTIGLYDEAT